MSRSPFAQHHLRHRGASPRVFWRLYLLASLVCSACTAPSIEPGDPPIPVRKPVGGPSPDSVGVGWADHFDRVARSAETVGTSRAAMHPPRITTLRAVRGPVALAVRGAVIDPDDDIERITLSFETEDGLRLDRPIRLVGQPGTPEEGHRITATILTAMVPPRAARVTVLVIDGGGHAVERSAPVKPRPIVGLGGVCDPTESLDRCVDGSLCVTADGTEPPRCIEGRAPLLMAAEAVGDGDRVDLRLQIVSPGHPIERVEVEPLDEHDRPTWFPHVLSVDASGDVSVTTVTLRDLSWPDAVSSMASVRVVAHDARGRRSTPTRVPIDPIDVLESGARCDDDDLGAKCRRGTRCTDSRCRAWRRVLVDPLHSALFVNRSRGAFGVRIEGHNPDRLALGPVHVWLSTGRDAIDGAWATMELSRMRCDATDRCTWFGSAPLPEAASAAIDHDRDLRARLRISGDDIAHDIAIEVRVESPREVALIGARCDALAVFDRCADPQVCHDAGAGAGPRCVRRDVDPFVDVRVTLADDPAALGVVVGSHVDDRRRLRIELSSADGRRIFPPEGQTFDVEPTRTRLGAEQVVARYGVRLADMVGPDQPPIDTADIERVRVFAIDPSGIASPPTEVETGVTPRMLAGQPCDPDAGWARCAAGLACVDVEDEGGVAGECAPRRADCPADWPVEALADAGRGTWIGAGDTSGLSSRVGARRGATAGEQVYRFTAPDDGRYRFVMQGDFSKALHARTHCLSAATEVDFDGGIGRAVILVDLVAGQRVFIFADGLGDAAGPFRLTASRHRAPAMVTTTAWRALDGRAFAVDLVVEPGTASIERLHLSFLDRTGLPLWPPRVVTGVPYVEGGVTGYRIESFAPRADVPHGGVRVIAEDADGWRSPPLDLAFKAPVRVGSGATCDALGARSICAAPSVCPEASGGEASICGEVDATCGDGWPVVDLTAAVRDDSWAYLRPPDARPVRRSVATACFEVTGDVDVYRFIAPEGGRYRFAVHGDPALGVFVRSACRLPDDLACGQPPPGDRDEAAVQAATVRLGAGEAVYLFVHTPRSVWSRGYGLTVAMQ